MKTRKLRDIEVSAIGMGCMGFSTAYDEIPTEEESIRLIHEAHDLDRNKFSESLIGNYARKKFQGVIPHTVNFGEIINCWVKK